MFSIFSLYSNEIIADPYDLYHYKSYWGLIFIVLYVVIINYSYMNIFTAFIFEESRQIAKIEESFYSYNKHLRRTGIK